MDADNCALAEGLVSRTYVQQGAQALARRRRLVKTLLSQRRLPERGWDDATIELLLQVQRWWRSGSCVLRGEGQARQALKDASCADRPASS